MQFATEGWTVDKPVTGQHEEHMHEEDISECVIFGSDHEACLRRITLVQHLLDIGPYLYSPNDDHLRDCEFRLKR